VPIKASSAESLLTNLPATGLSPAEFAAVMKRMAELEEKMVIMNKKPASMPPEKEQMLNTTITRADDLEKQLLATKKVQHYSLCALKVYNLKAEQSQLLGAFG